MSSVLVLLGAALAQEPTAVEDDATEKVHRRAAAEMDELAYDDQAADGLPADRFAQARLAMTFGEYDVARALLEPLAAEQPRSAEVQTNLGLAWMGTYYGRHGLS